MQRFDLQFKQNDTVIQFKEDSDELFGKDDKSVQAIIKVIVKEQGKPIAIYHRVFETFSSLGYFAFVKKFLEDPDYRQQLACSFGGWAGRVSFADHEQGINLKCRDAIKRLMSTKEPRFKDFADLKSFGRDAFSAKPLEELEVILGADVVQALGCEFDDAVNVLSAARWCARGLPFEYAVRKVKTDLEIRENAHRHA